MREGLKTLVVALVALLLAAGMAACGNDDSSSSTGAQADTSAQSGGGANGDEASQAGSDDQGKPGDDDGSSSGSSGGQGQSDGSSSYSGPDASDFVPRQHDDSGGGAEKYKVKGGDNSVQEFGEEADTSERDAAAVAVHNFLDARAEGNWAAACEYMAKNIIETFENLAAQAKQIEDSSCAGLLGKLTNPAAKEALKAEAAQADVGSLRIEDERAFVIYTGLQGTIVAMPVVNEDGTWKVSSLAGTPLN